MQSHGTSLRRYVLTRIALAVPTVLVLLTMVFLLMRVAPGNPIQAALGGHVSEQEIQRRSAAAGYDRPILTQYVDYLKDIATLNLGTTLTDHREVCCNSTSIVVENGSATMELSVTAFFVAVLVGITIGVLAGRFRDTPIDLSGRLFGIVIYATPVFFLGFVAQLVFGVELGWLPTSGRASPIVEYELDKVTYFYTLDSLITLRDHGVTPDYIQRLQGRGVKNLSIDQMVNLRIHGIGD